MSANYLHGSMYVDGRNPASIKQHTWSSDSTDHRAPQLNVVSCLLCVMQDLLSFNLFLFDAFPQLNVKEGARGFIHEFVRPVVQDFVHHQYLSLSLSG